MRVAMIGPDLNAQGGIATLARTLIESSSLDGIDVRYFATVSEGSKLRKSAQMARGQARFLRSLVGGWKADLFHIHVADGASFYRKLVYFNEARATGKPVILHNNFAHLEELVDKSPVHAGLVREAYSSATQVHAVSEDMAGQLRTWTDGKANVKVLYNPVPAAEFDFPSPRPQTDAPVVLKMGRVGERKGSFDLIAAWKDVVAAIPGARLRIGGDGDLDGLRREIAAAGVESSVDVLGWIGGEARLAAYAEADVYCLPSYAEGLPVSVLEAMASALPVVSTRVNGTPEAVIHGETGLLHEAGDREALARCLIDVLSDNDKRDRMGAASRARIKAVFDGDIIAATMRRYWEEALLT